MQVVFEAQEIVVGAGLVPVSSTRRHRALHSSARLRLASQPPAPASRRRSLVTAEEANAVYGGMLGDVNGAPW